MSIRAIADAVGVSQPSIYLHFPDKAELLFAVCEQQFGLLRTAMETAVSCVGDVLDELRARGRAYVEFGLAHREHYRILFMHKAGGVVGTHHDRVMEASAFAGVLDNVERAIAAGALAAADPMLVATGLWAGVHGLTSLLISKPEFPWPDVDTLIDHVLMTQAAGLSRPDTAP